MAANSGMLHVRIDDDLRLRGLEVLKAMGLTASDAVRILFHRLATDQAFPLELKVPNARTRAAMAEADSMIASGKLRFESVEEMFAALENGE